MGHKKKAWKTSKDSPYSAGQMNKAIDALVHPYYKKNQWIRVVDGALHALNEKNARVSAKKFLKYNMPEIVKKILEKLM